MPAPDAAFLRDAVGAIRSRAKSLKHKFFDVAVSHHSRDEGQSTEKIELILQRGRGSTSPKITLILWEDRWASIDAREGGRDGWKWFHGFEGRLSGDLSVRDLLREIEKFDILLSDAPERLESTAVNEFWTGKLLSGPARIVG